MTVKDIIKARIEEYKAAEEECINRELYALFLRYDIRLIELKDLLYEIEELEEI